jgi:sugar/nucleoside kinase (ribokinase family)
MRPDLLILGQVTVDHVVPARPGLWTIAIGGNALYAAAGARLVLDAPHIGVVARVGEAIAQEVGRLLAGAGLSTDGLVPSPLEPMTEWLLYEEDGSRQALPRLEALRDPTLDEATRRARYLAHLEAVSATLEDVPPAWRGAGAIHLAPQVRPRHEAALRALGGDRCRVSVDPSPHYTRGMDAEALGAMLRRADVVLPSRAEVEHLAPDRDWPVLLARLRGAGLREIVLKLGGAGALVLAEGAGTPVAVPAAAATVTDPTGAGDAFCGAYAACRLQGIEAVAAARRAAAAAALVIETGGAGAALALTREAAAARYRAAGG